MKLEIASTNFELSFTENNNSSQEKSINNLQDGQLRLPPYILLSGRKFVFSIKDS